LGQQGSQVASVFGTKGALFGGLLAIAAVLGQQLIPSLFESSKGFKELRESVEELGLSIREVAPFLFEKEQIRVQDELSEATDTYTKAKERLLRIEKDLSEASALYNSIEEDGIKKTAAKIHLDMTANKLAQARNKLDESHIALLKARAAAGQAVRPQMDTDPFRPFEVKEYTPQKDPLEALKRRADALKLSLDPMKAYQSQLQELQAMEANNLITTSEFTQAVKKLREQFIETGDEAEQFGLTLDDAKRTGIDSLEDGLVGLIEGTKSVKEAFSDMARSVISDLIRMQIQQSVTNPLAAALGIKRGAAIGGPVEGGRPYLVGEKGPELMVPNGSGRVIPNNRLGGGEAPVNVTLNISTGVAQTVRTEIASLMPQITNATKAAVVEARRRGGSFANAFGA